MHSLIRTTASATLEMLENDNLFIIPLDEERRWYRYHHLFADLLRRRLRQTHPEQMPLLHIQASEWNEQNGFVDQAIEYAFRAEDFERAARLIEGQADLDWQRGRHAKLRRWLGKLPVELLLSMPHLCIFHAWYLFAGGQQEAAEKSLQAAEQAVNAGTYHAPDPGPQAQGSLSNFDKALLRGRAAAIRAFMDSYRGDIPGILKHARLALEFLPKEDSVWRSMIAFVFGDVYGFKGDMTAAYEARWEALEDCKAAGNIYYVILASMKLAITVRAQGRLQQTLEICRQQIQLADENGLLQTSLIGLFFLIWGEVLAEFNDLQGASQQAKKGLELTERGVDLAMIGWGYMCLMRISFSRGDLAGAGQIIQKVQNIARGSNFPPWIMNQSAAWQARLWLEQDKLEAASQWVVERGLDTGAGKHKPPPDIDFVLLFDYIMLARILIAQGRLDECCRTAAAAARNGRKRGTNDKSDRDPDPPGPGLSSRG